MPLRTRDLRVENIRPLLPPAILLEELPVTEVAAQTVSRGREEVARILWGDDDRLIVVVGPCSIHDPRAAMDYARRLRALADEVATDLRLVMRVYFEKPRTTVGWKGLINDPHLDGSCRTNEGLRLGRRLLLDLLELGVPAASSWTRSRRSSSPTWWSGGRSAPGRRRARSTGSSPRGSRCRSGSRT